MRQYCLKLVTLLFLGITIHVIVIDGEQQFNALEFIFVKNPEHSICDKKEIDLLIYVHSSPGNLKSRLMIRETWAKRALFPRTRIVFMLGSSQNRTVSDLIELESKIYNDIVQQDFIDTYRNLTLKCIMALRWVSAYCKTPKFILKTDDDVIVIKNIYIFVVSGLFFIKIEFLR